MSPFFLQITHWNGGFIFYHAPKVNHRMVFIFQCKLFKYGNCDLWQVTRVLSIICVILTWSDWIVRDGFCKWVTRNRRWQIFSVICWILVVNIVIILDPLYFAIANNTTQWQLSATYSLKRKNNIIIFSLTINYLSQLSRL